MKGTKSREEAIPREQLGVFCDRVRSEGRRVVFTNGCFDLLHMGHVRLLKRAARAGDFLIIGLNDDESVRRLKGETRPVYPVSERAEILLALRWVDAVTIFPEDTPLETIHEVRPDVLVKGSEYREEDIVGASFVRSYGGAVLRVPMKRGYATRYIVDRIASRRVADAAAPRGEHNSKGKTA